MLLIDRLNMHFKSSYIESDIDFTSAELDIVDRMKNLETFEDVKKLAKELSEYCSKEKEEKDIEQLVQDDDGDIQMQDEEGENNDQGEQEQKEGNNEKDTTTSNVDTDKDEEEKEEQKIEEERFSTLTMLIYKINLTVNKQVVLNQLLKLILLWSQQSKRLLDKECKENEYFNPHEFTNLKEYVVDYKKVLQDWQQLYDKEHRIDYEIVALKTLQVEYKKFLSQQNKSVNYMVKEFEMKKSAAAYARTNKIKQVLLIHLNYIVINLMMIYLKEFL